MQEELWLIWKEAISRRRYKIGSLIKYADSYEFIYTNPELDDATIAGFKFFPGFEDLTKIYQSETLFPNILTRLPNVARPDYLDILKRYDLTSGASDFEILKATGGKTFTDNYEFVSAFDTNQIEFTIAGTNYCKDLLKCKDILKLDDKLYLEQELDNISDSSAVKIIFKDNSKTYHLGYVPRYYSKKILAYLNNKIKYSLTIKSINIDSPLNDEKITVNVKLTFDI